MIVTIDIFIHLFKLAGAPGFEPGGCQSQSLMPYRLAMPQQSNGGGGQIRTAEP